jgi:elongation factor 1-beta
VADWSSYEPTQADVVVFKSLPNPPTKATHPHAARWYKHIATYEKEFSSLPGDSSKSAADYVPVAKAQAAAIEAEADDDDEVDLFGSDDEEEDAEAERVKQERLKAYAEKKATKPKTIAKSIVTLDV